jgi:hypothetical protein
MKMGGCHRAHGPAPDIESTMTASVAAIERAVEVFELGAEVLLIVFARSLDRETMSMTATGATTAIGITIATAVMIVTIAADVGTGVGTVDVQIMATKSTKNTTTSPSQILMVMDRLSSSEGRGLQRGETTKPGFMSGRFLLKDVHRRREDSATTLELRFCFSCATAGRHAQGRMTDDNEIRINHYDRHLAEKQLHKFPKLLTFVFLGSFHRPDFPKYLFSFIGQMNTGQYEYQHGH